MLGRICHHPCETACRRNYYDEPLAIRPLHRVAYEAYQPVKEGRLPHYEATSGKHVAVVGSGPSALSAALDLMKQGHAVTIYEKDPTPGGALNSGVLGVELANRESASSWKEFLLDLRQRGLTGVEFVVSDDHPGLRRAIVEILPEAAWQRCYVHFLRNALDYLPRRGDDDCLQELRWIYNRRTIEEARAETLTLEEWGRLSDQLMGEQPSAFTRSA